MVNEYGAPLDSNGYAPSIIQDDLSYCYLSFRTDGKLDRHEIFPGAYRGKSKRLGLWVMLNHELHLHITQTDCLPQYELKRIAQQIAMERYGWTKQEFIRQFGKNYL
jgi:hypothetical protein